MRSTATGPAWVHLVGAALLAASCRSPPSDRLGSTPVIVVRDGGVVDGGRPVAAGPLRADRFAYQFAIYHLPRPATNAARVVARLLGGPLVLGAATTAGQTPARPTVWVEQPPIAQFPPPSEASLQYRGRGLSERDRKAVAASRALTVLAFAGPGDAAMATYHQALVLAGDVAAATGGLIYDVETRDLFTPAAWSARLQRWQDGTPDVVLHVTIDSYRDGDLVRMVTLGMAKLALPDLAVRDVAGADVKSMGTLINLVCATFVERPMLVRAGELDVSIDQLRQPDVRRWANAGLFPGAERKATIRLAAVEPDEGDAENRLVEIEFPGPAAELQVRQDALLSRLLGAREGPVRRIDGNYDREVLEVSRRARDAALALKPRYRDAPPLNEELMVKAPFLTPRGQKEWMWVEVVRWRGKTIKGVLRNDPVEVVRLAAGAHVEVQEDAIFDYLLTKPDGTTVGNETGPLIERQAR